MISLVNDYVQVLKYEIDAFLSPRIKFPEVTGLCFMISTHKRLET